ncbi:hypothetical protein C8J56DRAFT_989378 [Mycena floridula]|nr:hypothetical protein C8J56DRAFT_989378 [Mycena floridula]
MAKFPAELFLEILPWVPVKADLLSFRSTSKQFGSLATRRAFSTIAVDFNKQTALGFIALQNSELAKHVEKVEFLGGSIDFHDYKEFFDCANSCDSIDSHSHSCRQAQPSRLESLKDCIAALCLAFSGLTKFPALGELTLKFTSEFMEDSWIHDDDYFTPGPAAGRPSCSLSLVFQRQFLTAIADNSTSLTSLTTLNLINLVATGSKALYENPSFHQFLSIPKHLSISVLWEDDIDDDRQFIIHGDLDANYTPALQGFWQNHITKDILSSTSLSRLESLDLRSPEPILRMACGIITFPQLKKLSLTKVLFDLQGSVEDFIVRHKSSLNHLTLHTCSIYHHEYNLPRHLWSNIWDRFADELADLVSFKLTTKAANRYAFMELVPEIFEISLQMHGGRHWQDESIIREDKRALECFRSMVKTRQSERLII